MQTDADGTEIAVAVDGTMAQRNPDGGTIVQYPDGRTVHTLLGRRKKTLRGGSVRVHRVHPNRRVACVYARARPGLSSRRAPRGAFWYGVCAVARDSSGERRHM